MKGTRQLEQAREAVLNLERAIETLRAENAPPFALEPYQKALEVNRVVLARLKARSA